VLGSYAIARAADGVSAQAARTAAMLALLAVGLWVLGIVAGRARWRITLVASMAACLVPLFAIPLARSIFAVQLPPASVLLQVAGVTLAAIAGLTLWRRFGLARDLSPSSNRTPDWQKGPIVQSPGEQTRVGRK